VDYLDAKCFLAASVHIGSPLPTITWLKKGKKLKRKKTDDKHIIEVDEASSTLTIVGITPDDAGDYAARLTNPHGEVTAVAKVTITPVQNGMSASGTAPQTAMVTETPVGFKFGDKTSTLQCKVTGIAAMRSA
jgi:hypothetical protein